MSDKKNFPQFTDEEIVVINSLKMLISMNHLATVDTASSGLNYETYARPMIDVLVTLAISTAAETAKLAGCNAKRLMELTAYVQDGFDRLYTISPGSDTKH